MQALHTEMQQADAHTYRYSDSYMQWLQYTYKKIDTYTLPVEKFLHFLVCQKFR